jgi:hypothetical protein
MNKKEMLCGDKGIRLRMEIRSLAPEARVGDDN